jgi:hypothetical protein
VTKDDKAVKPMFVVVRQRNIRNHGDARGYVNGRSL